MGNAATRVHGRHQLEPRGQPLGGSHAGDRHHPVLERLAQRLERAAPELRQLVQEQHAVVGEADLARPRDGAAADEGGVAGRVVGAAEGAVAEQPFQPRAPGGVDRGRLHRLLDRERGQDPGDAPGQHRLAGAGWPDEDEVVAARGRDLQRAAGDRLPADVGHVGQRAARDPRRRASGRRRPRRRPRQPERLRQGHRGMDVDAVHDRGLGGVRGRHHRRPQALPPRHQHHRQHARHRPQRPVERELAHEQHVGQAPGIHGAVRGQEADGGGKVVGRPHLAQAGGGHADRDAAVPLELVTAVAQGGPDASLALLDRGVGEAEHRELRKPGGSVRLHPHEVGLDPEHGRRQRRRQHLAHTSGRGR